MAFIQDVHLEIVDNQANATVTVSYTLIGDNSDIGTLYILSIDLVGDDEGVGEDGHSERLSDAPLFRTTIRFGPQKSRFLRSSFIVSFNLLDEDRATNPVPVSPIADEIRARVTIIPAHAQVIEHSNVVHRRGRPLGKKNVLKEV